MLGVALVDPWMLQSRVRPAAVSTRMIPVEYIA